MSQLVHLDCACVALFYSAFKSRNRYRFCLCLETGSVQEFFHTTLAGFFLLFLTVQPHYKVLATSN